MTDQHDIEKPAANRLSAEDPLTPDPMAVDIPPETDPEVPPPHRPLHPHEPPTPIIPDPGEPGPIVPDPEPTQPDQA
jgi:hypothetical protein